MITFVTICTACLQKYFLGVSICYVTRSINDLWRQWFLYCRNVDLPFQWMVYKPQMPLDMSPSTKEVYEPPVPSVVSREQEEDRVPELDSVFSIQPSSGTLPASETTEYKLTFAPPVVNTYWLLHLHEIVEGLYFYFSLSVCACVCVCVRLWTKCWSNRYTDFDAVFAK